MGLASNRRGQLRGIISFQYTTTDGLPRNSGALANVFYVGGILNWFFEVQKENKIKIKKICLTGKS